MPLDDQRLIIEPSYPMARELAAIGGGKTALTGEDDADTDGWRFVNQWYSRDRRCDVIVMEKDGKYSHGLLPAFHHISHDIQTLGAQIAWGLEQESRALKLLGTMLRHHNFKQYIMTGMFLERSARSGITYVFRRLKPTVALAAHPGLPEEKWGMSILCCLCLHPIGYYADSWAGAMCPTDDVIAHLSLMRGDEAMFWKRANQIPPYRPEAGL